MMILAIGNRTTLNVRDFAHASAEYARERDASGEGASTFPAGRIMQSGRKIARLSYNGRVWGPKPVDGERPLYDPAGFHGDPQDLPRVNGVPQLPTER